MNGLPHTLATESNLFLYWILIYLFELILSTGQSGQTFRLSKNKLPSY